MKIVYTKHAKEMLTLRKINKKFVEKTLTNPDKVQAGKNRKLIYLKDFGKNYLKVVTTLEKRTMIVITCHWIARDRIK